MQEYQETAPIGSFTFIGANATVLPGITIGTNVIVAAGAVVIDDVPGNTLIAAKPAVIKKQYRHLIFNTMVSICMITYGQEKFIGQAIEGALMQETNFDYELIIVNDCSPDDTDKVIKGYINNHPKGSRIIYYRQEKNIGVMSNFAYALEKCTRKYIALCEGDDYWTAPDKLQKQVDFLQANPAYTICFHKVMLLQKNKLVDDWITSPPKEDTDINDLIECRNYIHTPSVVFRNKMCTSRPRFYLVLSGIIFCIFY